MSEPRQRPRAYLIHGYLAVGKTTFARQLSASTGAIRFSIDECYLRLYTDGTPTEHLSDVLHRRLKSQLDELWPELLARGLDVILDFGYWSRAERDHARALAASAGGEAVLYSLTCDETTARERLAARNADSTASFLLPDLAYDRLRRKFEDLDEDEPRTAIDTAQR